MPFTLSHPAAAVLVWPLVRRGTLPLAAVVIGAMSPDFEFFLHLRPLARWSHTPGGLVGFCLPAGLVVFTAWAFVVRAPLRHLLGLDAQPNRRRPHLSARAWAGVAAGILLGAATHLVWDGFTHGDYWGTQLAPVLRAPALTLGGRGVPWFNVLQHASTVAGGAAVLAWSVRAWRQTGASRAPQRPAHRGVAHRRMILATCGAVALGAGLLNGARWGAPTGYWGAQVWLGRVAVGAMLGLALSVLAYGASQQLRQWPERDGQAS